MLSRYVLLLVCTGACAQDLAVGRRIFESQCALCHGQTGGGGRGPGLNRPALKHAPDDAALRNVISQGIDPEMPGAWQLHPQELVSVAAYVRSLGAMKPETLPGNAGRGEAVYQRTGCAACHVVAGAGTAFGPELTAVGSRRSGEFLRKTLLDPASSLPEQFEYVAVTPLRGNTVRGIRINEDSFTIQLKDTSGRFHSFRKSEIKELKRLEHETPMPPAGKQLSPADLDDLVAYLAGLRGQS